MGSTETKYSKKISYDKVEEALITQTKISDSYAKMLHEQYKESLDSCILRKTMRKKLTHVLKDIVFFYGIIGYFMGKEILAIKSRNKIYLVFEYANKNYFSNKLKIMEAYNFKEDLDLTIMMPNDDHLSDLYHFVLEVDLKTST